MSRTASLPAYSSISHLIGDEKAAADFFVDKGVLCFPELCPKCGNHLRRENKVDATKRTYWNVRCGMAKQHEDGKPYKASVASETIFRGMHVKKAEFIFLVYLWLFNTPLGIIRGILGWSKSSMTDWNNYLMEVVTLAVTAASLDTLQLGGEGGIVHVDESKFGSRKYYVSTHVISECAYAFIVCPFSNYSTLFNREDTGSKGSGYSVESNTLWIP